MSAALLFVIARRHFGSSVWQLPQSELIVFIPLISAFLASGLYSITLPRPAKWRDLTSLLLFTGAVFGLVFFGLIITKAHFAGMIALYIFCTALVLIPLPHLFATSIARQRFALGVLAIVTLAAPSILSVFERIPEQRPALLRSEYFNLSIDTYAHVFPKSVMYGGAIARFGDRYLLVTADGQFQLFGWSSGSQHIETTPLPFRVPSTGSALSEFANRPLATPHPGSTQSEIATDGLEIVNTEWMRTHGLLVQETGTLARIFVSYNYWRPEDRCFVERVSVLEAEKDRIIAGAPNLAWRTLFQTSPCLPVTGPQSRRGNPFVGYFGGGRMALLDSKTILLTVGDFGFNGVASVRIHPQDPASSYGKTIVIDIASGASSLFTLGHHNPQGLFIDREGAIWSTEHDPHGGDELNRLVRGKNYGWPYVTGGTDDVSLGWPLSRNGEQRSFEPPLFAWVPSVAISNLIAVEKTAFPDWRGDLLIATLNAETIYRARLRSGRVAYLEAIHIGSSIRDLVEGHDGRLVLWTDDQKLILVRPHASTPGETIIAK